jgi:hypothetical protein
MAKNLEIEVSVAEVVDYTRLNNTFEPALREVVERKVAADAAKKSKIGVSTQELQKASDIFRMERGLLKARDTEKWLKDSGISLEAFEEYLETNLLINKFKESLARKANKQKYASTPEVKEVVKEMVYRDWMKNAIK